MLFRSALEWLDAHAEKSFVPQRALDLANAYVELRATEPRAALAVDVFCYQARKSIGALAAALGGIETLVFAGGIGEHALAVRFEICRGLDHLGITLDDDRNSASAPIISKGRCEVHVIRTDEERMIARHARRLILGNAASRF